MHRPLHRGVRLRAPLALLLGAALAGAAPAAAQATFRTPSEAIESHVLPHGTRLFLHYNLNTRPIEEQVGTLALYRRIESDIRRDFAEYYDRTPGGRNKFFESVELRVYSRDLPFPRIFENAVAHAEPRGRGSKISIQYIDPPAPGGGKWRFPGSASHEFGHAWDYWSGGLRHRAFYEWWNKQVSTNQSVYLAGAEPWTRDKPEEQFANAWRYFGGTRETRGSSANADDPVITGFQNPAARSEWRKMLQLLPEAAAYWDRYGLKQVRWDSGAGAFIFQDASGKWVQQRSFYDFYQYYPNTRNWLRFRPEYDRS